MDGRNSSIVIVPVVPFSVMLKSAPLSLLQASVYDVNGSSISSGGGAHSKVSDDPLTLTEKFCGASVGTERKTSFL